MTTPTSESAIDAFLRQQRQGIDRLARSAGEAARAEVERAVRQGLADAFRRLADELPRIAAAASRASRETAGKTKAEAAPAAETNPDHLSPMPEQRRKPLAAAAP